MQNLLVYLNPKKWFADSYNTEALMETQIENALSFWKPESILVVTNFPYEHKGVKAKVVPDALFCEADAKASKINAICYLLEKGLLPELTWFHDLDAFQLAPIDLKLKKELGFTSYGYKPQWNTGSFFFKPSALPVFKWIRDGVYKWRANEEPVLWRLTQKNFNGINSHYEKLNNTYNIGMRETDLVISLAQNPLRVAHFPPHWRDTFDAFKPILPLKLISLINEKYYDLPKS